MAAADKAGAAHKRKHVLAECNNGDQHTIDHDSDVPEEAPEWLPPSTPLVRAGAGVQRHRSASVCSQPTVRPRGLRHRGSARDCSLIIVYTGGLVAVAIPASCRLPLDWLSLRWTFVCVSVSPPVFWIPAC